MISCWKASEVDPIVAPAAMYASSEKSEAAPAPDSTMTLLKPAFKRAWTPAGVRATRRSFAWVSLGIPEERKNRNFGYLRSRSIYKIIIVP